MKLQTGNVENISNFFAGTLDRKEDLKSLVSVLLKSEAVMDTGRRHHYQCFEGYMHSESVNLADLKATVDRLSKQYYTKQKLINKSSKYRS